MWSNVVSDYLQKSILISARKKKEKHYSGYSANSYEQSIGSLDKSI